MCLAHLAAFPSGPWEALFWPLSSVVPGSALWTFFSSILVHDCIWGGCRSYAFLGGFTVFISCFLLAQVLESRDYFRVWRDFCRPSLLFLWSYNARRNLVGFWSICAQSVPCVGNPSQRCGLDIIFKYKSPWHLLSSVITPFSFT